MKVPKKDTILTLFRPLPFMARNIPKISRFILYSYIAVCRTAAQKSVWFLKFLQPAIQVFWFSCVFELRLGNLTSCHCRLPHATLPM